VLAGDNAGWPNGRRPIDDVTDVAVRVVGGENYLMAGDNVNMNDLPLPDTFPFLATPWDGFNRVHQNPPAFTPMTPTPTPFMTQTGTPPSATPIHTFTPTGTVFVPSNTPTGTQTVLPPPSVTPTRTVTGTPSVTPTQTGSATPGGLLPDLTIDSLTIRLQHPACFLPGDPLGVWVGIVNNGQAAAGSFMVNVNGVSQSVNGLAAGQATSVFFPGYTNPVTAVVDSTDVVTESNENNNSRTEMVPVPTAPLSCTPTPTPTP
jgi:hypothetical protein